jgi:mono/diheme cytochrome c family protein
MFRVPAMPARGAGSWRPGALGLLLAVGTPAAAAPTYADVAPILAERCAVCHNGPAAPAGLRLDGYQALIQGGQRGPVVKPGDAAGSELIRRVRGDSQPRMPLTGPPYLSDQQIALLTDWVAAGAAPGEAPVQPAAPAARPPGPGEPVTFAHVAPILLQRCVKCHTDGGLMGNPPEGLRLKTWELATTGGERAVVIPGNPGASELVRRVRGQALPRMPFDGPPYLDDEQIRLIGEWVAQGARDAQGRPAPVPSGAQVRLHGILTGQWELDGMPFTVDGGTRLDKGPGAGDYVELRGVVLPDGGIRATRLRPR